MQIAYKYNLTLHIVQQYILKVRVCHSHVNFVLLPPCCPCTSWSTGAVSCASDASGAGVASDSTCDEAGVASTGAVTLVRLVGTSVSPSTSSWLLQSPVTTHHISHNILFLLITHSYRQCCSTGLFTCVLFLRLHVNEKFTTITSTLILWSIFFSFK